MAGRHTKKGTRANQAASDEQTIALAPKEQLAFWKALHAPVRLTAAQKKLGKLMQGKSPTPRNQK